LRLALGLWIAGVLVSSAYLPRLRELLSRPGGGGFQLYVAAGLAALAAAALATAWVKTRGRRRDRLSRLAALASGGALGLALLRNPDSRSRFIEISHLGEYGVLAALAYGVMQRTETSVALSIGVGLLDESLQWILPARTAEIRDVALNGLSGAIGAGYAAIVFPSSATPASVPARLRSAALCAATLLPAAGMFLHAVHRGHRLEWDDIEFVSSFTGPELDRLGEDRRARWSAWTGAERAALARPDATLWGVEDFFVTEALRHVQARNDAAERGDGPAAAAENRLLERWYAPFLDLVGGRRNDIPAGHRAAYRSPALAHLWPWLTPLRLWCIVGAVELVLIAGLWATRSSAR
jgi:VanZ family protein